MICEICGGRSSRLRKVIVEGSVMNVCPDCFNTLTKKIPVETRIEAPITVRKPVKPVREKKPVKPSLAEETVELVSNHGELIRSRMRELGWSEEDLGSKTGLKVSFLKKVVSGKIVPSIVDARKIEDALKTRLIKPNILGETQVSSTIVRKPSSSITLGELLQEEASRQEES
ncbi:MAG: helix-turn-helix domain-containing protein [Thermoproteota archaeon]